MATQIVKIKIKSSDIVLEYDPPLGANRKVPVVSESDLVTWEVEGGIVKWVVDFCPYNVKGGARNPAKRRSPFKAKRLGASGLNSKKTEKPEKGSSGGSGKSSTYSYAVAVLDDKGRLYALDPDIRIRGGAMQKVKPRKKKPSAPRGRGKARGSK